MKIDPRTRIILVFLISSAAVVIKELIPLLFLLLLALILCRMFSASLSGSIRKLRKLLYFFIVLALIQSIFTPGGETMITAGGLRILTTEGLETGISIIIRMSAIILSALIIASAPAMDVVYGLIAMKLPYEIAFMVLLSIKFLPLFREEFADSIIAVQLAGADLARIPLKQKLSLYSYVLTPSVIKALNRARFISLSMESRGFRIYPDRTSYCKLSMSKMDYVTIIAASAAVFLIISYNFKIIG
ncbi:MAG: energy-coupling factor transporter transmembrane protein EcfT [Clostridia bacterium]|nr:energy-coupling factor transporter transmembrane protein EcfT [Clostridia bacterium]HOH89019.1 energy-coupling factor transporter transmembrane component T [Bacillota bacterium]